MKLKRSSFTTKILLSMVIFSICAFFSIQKSYSLEVQPVNNGEIQIPIFPTQNPNMGTVQVNKRFAKLYQRNDGRIHDTFIPYEKSIIYVKTLNNGNNESITLQEKSKIASSVGGNDGADEEDIAEKYLIMHRRILAPTISKSPILK